jgi:pimeloyl-ACP methyl ester carboxylesterase
VPRVLRHLAGRLVGPVELERRRIERKLHRHGFSPHRAELAGVSLTWWMAGRGPPLWLLHGFGASAPWQWHGQVAALARHHTVVFPDLVFFGESRSARPERGLELQVEAVLALADRLGHRRLDLLGLSYGGFVAAWIAALHPGRVRRLVLSNSPGAVMRRADHDDALARLGVPSMEALLLPDTDEGVGRLIRLAWHRPPPVPRFALREARAMLYSDQVEEKRGLLRALLAHLDTPTEALARWAAPTLVLWGAHDPIFPVELGRRLADALEQAELHVIPRTAHAPNLERPRLYNRLVREFLAR